MSTAPPPEPTPGGQPQPAGVADAERLAAAIRTTPAKPKPGAKKKGPVGRPPIRARPESRQEPDATVETFAPEAAKEQLLTLTHGLAALRARRFEPAEALTPEEQLLGAYRMSGPIAEMASGAFAQTMNKYLPAAEDRPELRLGLILIPWLLGIVVAEVAYYQHTRAARAAAAGGERDSLRPKGVGQDHADPLIIGVPFPVSDR